MLANNGGEYGTSSAQLQVGSTVHSLHDLPIEQGCNTQRLTMVPPLHQRQSHPVGKSRQKRYKSSPRVCSVRFRSRALAQGTPWCHRLRLSCNNYSLCRRTHVHVGSRRTRSQYGLRCSIGPSMSSGCIHAHAIGTRRNRAVMFATPWARSVGPKYFVIKFEVHTFSNFLTVEN